MKTIKQNKKVKMKIKLNKNKKENYIKIIANELLGESKVKNLGLNIAQANDFAVDVIDLLLKESNKYETNII